MNLIEVQLAALINAKRIHSFRLAPTEGLRAKQSKCMRLYPTDGFLSTFVK